MPQAISERVCTEQGATIMPIVWNEPEAIEAPTFLCAWTTWAMDSISWGLKSVSEAMVSLAESLMTRCASTSDPCNACRIRTP